ncbi:MAG TPA: GatB/YqeY domain-containing protein [Dehalococcoidia bacterium]|nr:GatB/YqeY domain-containing protein [Dehalococcoidia bacterium]
MKERMAADLQQALRRGDDAAKRTIRLALAAIHNAEVAAGHPVDDKEVMNLLQKQVRQRHESIDAFRRGGRPDLVAREEAELEVLREYLPPPLTMEEIAEAARQVISEVGARGPADKGKVMPVLIAQLAGRADGRQINAVVSELLGSPAGR